MPAVKTVTVTLPAAGGPAADFGVSCSSLDCTFEDLSTDAGRHRRLVGLGVRRRRRERRAESGAPLRCDERTLVTARLTVTDGDGLEAPRRRSSPSHRPPAPVRERAGHRPVRLLRPRAARADATVTVSLDEPVVRRARQRLPDHRTRSRRHSSPTAAMPRVGTAFNLNGGACSRREPGSRPQVVSGAGNQITAPALHVTGAYPTWTLAFDDGVGGSGSRTTTTW